MPPVLIVAAPLILPLPLKVPPVLTATLPEPVLLLGEAAFAHSVPPLIVVAPL